MTRQNKERRFRGQSDPGSCYGGADTLLCTAKDLHPSQGDAKGRYWSEVEAVGNMIRRMTRSIL